jgi:hypothetical protein
MFAVNQVYNVRNQKSWWFPLLMNMVVCSCGPSAEPGKKDVAVSMKAEEKMNENVFEMNNEDFFAVPLQVSPEVGKRLIRNGFQGLFLSGPETVDLHKYSKFPVVTVRVEEAMEASRRLFKEFALITAINLDDGVLHAGFFVEQKFVKVKRDLDQDPPPPGKVADAASVDLFARISVPKYTGEYLVTAILLDRASNRIRVKVGESDELKNEATFRKTIDRNRKLGKPRIRVEGEASIGNGGAIPPLPHEVGIELNAYLSPVPGNARPEARLRVAFRLPKGRSESSSKNEEAVAGVPITVLATGSRVSAPFVWSLEHVDVNRNSSIDRPSNLGAFDVRLSDLGGLEGNQTYAIYAFSGEVMSKPVLLHMD